MCFFLSLELANLLSHPSTSHSNGFSPTKRKIFSKIIEEKIFDAITRKIFRNLKKIFKEQVPREGGEL